MKEKELEEELKYLPSDWLYPFIERNFDDLVALVKPGNRVLVLEEGYFCSKCNLSLNEEESNWAYCNNCLTEFDCCEDNCEVCGGKVETLVLETYRNIHADI